MDKNKIKKMAVFASGLVLSGTISYTTISKATKLKPLTSNTYSISKVGFKEYNQFGVIDKPLFSKNGDFDSKLLTSSICIKTPFYEKDGIIKRDIYNVDISRFTKEELDFIIENINNQKMLFEKEYIKEYVDMGVINYSDIKCINGVTYVKYEIINDIPYYNDFEVSYLEYIPNSNEIVYYNSKYLDSNLNINYITCTLLSTCLIYMLYFGTEKLIKNIVKKK